MVRHRQPHATAAATAICLAAAVWAGGTGGTARAAGQYPGVVAVAGGLPTTLDYSATRNLTATVDFGVTFTSIESVCFEAQFVDDLLDPGEDLSVLFASGGGIGQMNQGPAARSSVSLCLPASFDEWTRLFLDGNETVTFATEPDFPDVTASSITIASLTAVITGVSSADDCTVLGTAGSDRLVGTPGRDVICGFDGNDTIWGYAGNDTILGGSGKDTIYGGPGSDIVDGGEQGDLLYGGDGNDTLLGGGGWDDLYGNAGNDSIHGGTERDLANGGSGNDWIELDDGDDQVAFGGDGDDNLFGGDQADRLYGGSGDDGLIGGSGDDELYGGPGNDTLVSQAGSDWVCGERGDDWYIDLTAADHVCPYDFGDV